MGKNPAHAELLKAINKTPTQFSTYWQKVMFSGAGAALQELPSDANMVQCISKTPRSLGYIDYSTPHGDVKTIAIK